MDSKEQEFELIIYDIMTHPTVQQMKHFKQHCDTSCYEHCKKVAYYSYLICKKYGLDYISVARAGMLHDLFLYDWRIRENGRKGFHAFTHPKTALHNAMELFPLNAKEIDIIIKHMWPCTIRLPKYTESYILTFVDKFCAIQETYSFYKNKISRKKMYRYAYLFLCLFVFRIV